VIVVARLLGHVLLITQVLEVVAKLVVLASNGRNHRRNVTTNAGSIILFELVLDEVGLLLTNV
jgi:hypothetical protein